jgi:hypothetical protein
LTLPPPFLLVALTILLEAAAFAVIRLRIGAVQRPDGTPSLALLRATAAIDLAGAAVLVSAAKVLHWPLLQTVQLWRHDLPSAILIGALAGFFLNVAGGGSPLAIASIILAGWQSCGGGRRHADQLTLLVFVLGEIAATFLWFGAALGSMLRVFPRLVTLALVAGGFGLRRAAAGQDHALLGAVDGLLLSVLALLSRSLVAVLVARGLSDLLAYVRVAGELDEVEGFAEGHRPTEAR